MPASSAYEYRRLARVETIISNPGSSIQDINTHLLDDGALVWCSETQSDWRFRKGSTVTADNIYIVQPSSGPGRFHQEIQDGTVRGQILTWNGSAWVQSSELLPLSSGDLNSLVQGNLYGREWHAAVPAHYPVIQVATGVVPPDNFQEAVGVNIDSNGTNFSQLTRYFSVPAGTTSIELSVALKRFDAGTPSAPKIELWSGTFGALLNSTVCNLTAGWATYTTGPVAVVPGTDFTARLAVGPGLTGGSQQACYAGRLSVIPLNGAGLWAAPFRRLNLDPRVLQDNGYSTFADPHFWYSTQYARAVIDTDATELGIEFFNSLALTFPGQPATTAIGVIVDGRPYGTITVAAGQLFNQFGTITLPAGMKRVEIVSGGVYNTSGAIANAVGAWLVGLYVPADASARLVPAERERPLVIYGDSIASGFFADTPPLDGWPALLRNAYPTSVVSESWAGRALFYDAPATVTALVTQLAKYDAERYWLCIGRNDWASTLWTVANFQTRYGELLDALHAARPAATIYGQSPVHQTFEGANGNGETLAQFRTAVQTAVAARAWAVFVDGTTILTAPGDFIDGVHPNDLGSAKYAAFVMNAVGA